MKFKDWLNFREMAVGTINYGNLNQKSLQSEKYNTKFHSILDKYPGVTFNFGFCTLEEATQMEQSFKKEGAISIILTSGFQKRIGNQMPLTPWTRLHRAAHGFADWDSPYSSRLKEKQRSSMEAMSKVLTSFHELKKDNGQSIYTKDVFRFSSIDSLDCSFKIVDNYPEIFREILTEYIWHSGRIRHNNIETTGNIAEHIAALENVCKSIIQSYVGEMMVEQIDFD